MIRVQPLTPDRLRWSRAFVAAGWGLAWPAHLFNLDPEALAAALEAA